MEPGSQGEITFAEDSVIEGKGRQQTGIEVLVIPSSNCIFNLEGTTKKMKEYGKKIGSQHLQCRW